MKSNDQCHLTPGACTQLSHTSVSDFKFDTPVATLPGTWLSRVQWLPCQEPGFPGSALVLGSFVSIHCYRMT